MNKDIKTIPSLIPGEEIPIPDEHRLPPRDDGYLSTSPWQLIDYPYELHLKSKLLEKLFADKNLDNAMIATDNNDSHYRNKMEYSLFWSHEDEKIHLAFHLRRSYRKFPIKTSVLERAELLRRAQEIVDDLNARHEEARKYQSIFLRCDQQGNVEGGLFEKGQPHPTFNNLTDTILGYEYSYSPNGFFQINLPVYEMALEEIKQHISTDHVLDLYAGVGTIGLSVARDRHLTLVESNPAAFAELQHNVDNCQRSQPSPEGPAALLCKSEEALDLIRHNQTLILDPPRAGCAEPLINAILDKTPEKLIYLSCNPLTQVRDLKALTIKYKITKIQPYNFFPRTPHLENLVILEQI